MSNDTSTKRPH